VDNRSINPEEGKMAEDFKVGDIVFLKSGSPALVIENIVTFKAFGEANVSWFAGDFRNSTRVPLACLRK
jgi:uncharacterized protein YodC (DUF2158 family)